MEKRPLAWKAGKCGVPMWMMGTPAGYCDRPAFGPQLPREVLRDGRGWITGNSPFCPPGPCCPMHGGPNEGEPIVFQDGLNEQGRPMYCAVMPDFIDLQSSPAGFDSNGNVAIANLRAAIANAA